MKIIKPIKVFFLIVLSMLSLVLISGCSLFSPNLEGTYKAAVKTYPDGGIHYQFVTIKKVNDNSYELKYYFIADARNLQEHPKSVSTPSQYRGHVVIYTNGKRYMATLNQKNLNGPFDEQTYTVADDGVLKSKTGESNDLTKISDDIQELKDFSPIDVNDLLTPEQIREMKKEPMKYNDSNIIKLK